MKINFKKINLFIIVLLKVADPFEWHRRYIFKIVPTEKITFGKVQFSHYTVKHFFLIKLKLPSLSIFSKVKKYNPTS